MLLTCFKTKQNQTAVHCAINFYIENWNCWSNHSYNTVSRFYPCNILLNQKCAKKARYVV